ncbi:MAG: hypothetical protein RL199_274 [Pseudomonadota bacterium]|jgi:hypothetical protein
MRHPLLALADVHRLTTFAFGRSLDVYVFDHHRTAFTVWCHEAARRGRPLTLVTLDRHMDLNPPRDVAPSCEAPLEQLDLFARHRLAPSNDDHIPAALEAGAVGDALVVARSHPPPSLEVFRPYRDTSGRTHAVEFAPTVARLHPGQVEWLRAREGPVVLDVDLDCFTTMSDGDPDDVLTWDADQIHRWLTPPGAEAFWDVLRERVEVVTLAREPYHCGGFDRGARLWSTFAEVFFGRVLGTDAP